MNADDLKAEWLGAFREGAQRVSRTLPAELNVAFPYYGDALARFTRELGVPLTSDIRARGGPEQDEFLEFQAELAETLRQRAGITDAQVNEEYGLNPKPKGPLNWEWVQAILRTLDNHGGILGGRALELFTRDVFLYTRRPTVRQAIDRIVAPALAGGPCIVVSHSLGSVVAYSVLRAQAKAQVPLYVTLGSPLAIRAVRDMFVPLRFPGPPVQAWLNAFDQRDVVALYPLDRDNFPVAPPIQNYASVDNPTPNRHGIIGYLKDPHVVERITAALVG
jgi:hypothetical protein